MVPYYILAALHPMVGIKCFSQCPVVGVCPSFQSRWHGLAQCHWCLIFKNFRILFHIDIKQQTFNTFYHCQSRVKYSCNMHLDFKTFFYFAHSDWIKFKHNTGNKTKITQNKSIHPDKVGELQPQEGGKAVNGKEVRRSKMNITKHRSSLETIVSAEPNLWFYSSEFI